jgi:hypothetical protein
VRERIAPEITASLFANYRSSADAVMELIDNAVDSRIPGSVLSVEIVVHPQSLVVSAEGGEGMGPRELERNYLRWGGSPKRGRQMLGQYGQGGKAAIGHLGQRFAVEASQPGDGVAWRFTDDNYRDRSRLKTYELVEVTKRTPPEVGYVRIRIDGIDKRIDSRRLAQRLGETYRPLLEQGLLKLVLDRAQIQPSPLPLTERQPFAVNTGGGRLRGWIGLADHELAPTGWIPGVRCYRLGRLIVDGEFFGHPGPATVPALVRLVGEVDVPQVELTMNKSDFARDSQQWIAVEMRMHKLLAPWVRKLELDLQAPPPVGAVKIAEQVRRLLSQALRMSERSDLFAGFATARPASRQRRTGEELPLEQPPSAGKEPATPHVPRAATGDTPPDRRTKGFGLLAVRALDPKVRSMTVLEDGVRTVVINSRYPLFIQRHGDVWYQLETAAREIFKAEGSVAEYEKRVSEIVLTALQLRSRRRRHPASRQMRLIEE